MPASKPPAPALLDAAIDYLERELLPALAGYHRFQCRVTVNVLAQVRRELALAATQADAERARLVSLLGHPGDRDELSRDLAARIRAGAISLDDPALLAQLALSFVTALQGQLGDRAREHPRIDTPRYRLRLRNRRRTAVRLEGVDQRVGHDPVLAFVYLRDGVHHDEKGEQQGNEISVGDEPTLMVVVLVCLLPSSHEG
jgi:hypothetical protein